MGSVATFQNAPTRLVKCKFLHGQNFFDKVYPVDFISFLCTRFSTPYLRDLDTCYKHRHTRLETMLTTSSTLIDHLVNQLNNQLVSLHVIVHDGYAIPYECTLRVDLEW